MQDLKLFDLDRILNYKKPKKILELGSGCSSYIFCEYALQSDAEYTIVEESEEWLQNTKKLAPKEAHENGNIQFIKGNKILFKDKTPIESRFQEIFSKKFDLVFIDGPTLKVDGVQNSNYINTDIFEITKNHLPETIVVDIRKYTVKEIQKRLGHYYEWTESDLFDLHERTLSERVNYFTVFTLKK